eukprot:Ihof_evm1s683 gene=Ihof_evmTU1s683
MLATVKLPGLVKAIQPLICIKGLPVIKRCAFSTRPSWDDQFIQKSPVPSMHFQSSLPRLPVPRLKDTLSRYLAALQPLCNDREFKQAQVLASDFSYEEGLLLQQELELYNMENKHTSFISEAWFNMYLDNRSPLPINFNPYISWNNDPNPAKNGQDVRAAVLIRSALRFYRSVKANEIKPDLYHMHPKKTDNDKFLSRSKYLPGPLRFPYAYMNGVFPLDMSQYDRLFQSTRIPHIGRDKLYSESTSRHIAVMRRNRFYTFEVIKPDGNIHTCEDILANIQAILKDDRPADSRSLGSLTTENRDVWATVRNKLVIDPVNAQSLHAIDSALFLTVLDDTSPGENNERAITQLHRQLLVGDGKNRWFDKSFSMIVLPDGVSAVNFEHSWGDGISVLRFVNEVFADATEAPVPHTNQNTSINELKFNVTPDVGEDIDKALKRFEEESGKLEFYINMGDVPLGKKALKKHNALGLGSDALCQFAFQLAYYRLYGKTASTYESCSTAAFKHGRTETIRPNTMETLNAAKAFMDQSCFNEEKLAKLKLATAKHTELTRNAASGKGFDRHLFMLKTLNTKAGRPLPPFFKEGGFYDRLGHIILSTSTLQSPAIHYGGFGPVNRDCWGIGYSLLDEAFGLSISNFQGNSK